MKASTIFKSAVTIIAMFSCLLFAQAALATTTTFTETFTSTTYKASNTTAVWNTATGQVSLPTTSTANYTQKSMHIARDTSSNIVMVWIDNRNGAIDVYGAKYNTSGTKLWGDKKLNQSVLLDGVWDQAPRVACDSSNNIYVSYAISTGNLRVLKYDSNGNFLWDRQADSAAYSAEWCLHDIAIDSSNGIYIVYQRYGPQGTGSFMSKFDVNGNKLWGDKYTGVGNDPCVATNNGYVYVASSNGTVARINPADGSQLLTYGIGSVSQARIVVDSIGYVSIVYYTNYTVQFERFSTAGSRVSGPVLVSVPGQIYLQKEMPAITIDSSNNKYITFRDRYNTGNGYDYRLMGVKLSQSDTNYWTQGGIQLCNVDFIDQSAAAVAHDGAGGLFGVWMANSNLYANKISSAGTRVWSSDLALFSSSIVYAANAFVQTTAIDTATSNVTAATLTYNATLNGQTVNFRMTSNGGTNWYDVTPGTKITFPLAGSDLRFMATLITANNAVTPVLNDVTIVYDHSDTSGTGTFPYRMYWDTTWLNGLTGWMGSSNGASLTCDPAFTGDKFSGTTSTKFTYNPAVESWAGIYSLYSGSWNGAGINLTGNKRLTFMAKSSVNGVVVTFGTGQDTDSAKKEAVYILTTSWQKISIDLTGLNLSSINGVWYFFIEASRNTSIASPITFYVDEASYEEIPVTTDTTAPTGTPSTPTDQGASTTSTSLTFNWTIGTSTDPESCLTGYYLQVAKDTGFTNLVFNTDVGNVTSYIVTSGVTSGSTYYARVRAKNGAGLYSSYSAASDGIAVVVPDTTAPVISSIASSGITVSGATITWTTNEASDTQVEYGLTTSYGSSTSLNTSMVTSHSVVLAGLNASTLYHYRVKSRDAAGNLATSADYTFTTANSTAQTKNYAPTATSVFQGTGLGTYANMAADDNSSFSVNAMQDGAMYYTDWYTYTMISENEESVSKITVTLNGHYTALQEQVLYLYNFDSNSWDMFDSRSIATTDQTVTFSTTDIASHISIVGEIRMRLYTERTSNVCCYADYVNFAVELNGAGDSTAPILSSITSSGITVNGATITWATNEASDTQVEYGLTTSYSTSTALNSSLVTSHSVNMTGLKAGTVYHYRVQSRDAAGNLATSADYTFTTAIDIDTTAPTGLPSTPTDAGNTSTSTTITFNWTAGTVDDAQSGIAGYYLQVSPDTDFTTFIYNGDVGKVLTKTITDCLNGTTYYARVMAKNGAGLYGNYTAASDGIRIYTGTTPTYTVDTTTYSWITTSTATGITADDQSKLFTLPFTFQYYGVNYTSVYICSNGFMSFTSASTDYAPATIPNTAAPNALLAAYWRDLNPSKSGSSITYSSSSTRFVVTWSVYNYANSNKQTFQIILYPSGEIRYQYQSITKDLTTVIGVENQAGTAGKSYAAASINNGLALRFTPAMTTAAILEYVPNADFIAGESYIFPNPAKEGKKPVIHVEVGQADKVEVYIYDVAGDLQDSFEITDTLNIIDGKYAYEYQWDNTDKVSGVYIARIVATKGSDKLKITKKFAIVK